MEGAASQEVSRKFLFCFSVLATEAQKNVFRGGQALSRRGISGLMARRQTTKKAARKRSQPVKGVRKTESKPKAVAETAAREAERAPRKRTARKLDRKKLSAMVDRMLLQLAERVEEGECTITTSEG